MEILNNFGKRRVINKMLHPIISVKMELLDTQFSHGAGAERRQCKHFYRKQVHFGARMQCGFGTFHELNKTGHT